MEKCPPIRNVLSMWVDILVLLSPVLSGCIWYVDAQGVPIWREIAYSNKYLFIKMGARVGSFRDAIGEAQFIGAYSDEYRDVWLSPRAFLRRDLNGSSETRRGFHGLRFVCMLPHPSAIFCKLWRHVPIFRYRNYEVIFFNLSISPRF